MKVSIIIPTYNDNQALTLILDALQLQTYKDFEIIVAEDNNSFETKELLEKYISLYMITHISHENMGNRKAIIMNRALEVANGKYIICIDGDTIPFSTFIEHHVSLSGENTILCGRRVNLGTKVSSDLRKKKIQVNELETTYIRKFIYLNNDNIRHYEQGFVFKPNSFVQVYLHKKDKNIHLVASNYSCYKKALFSVNGFDEELPFAPHRDDTDLEWRLQKAGYTLKSCKFCANLFHLDHPRNDRKEEGSINKNLIYEKQKNNYFVARKGIINNKSR